MTFSWGEIKDDIERLYMKEGKSLNEVREILKHRRNFNASVRAYKDKFEEWGYRKYNARRKVPATVSPNLARDLNDEKCCKPTQVASGLLSGLHSGVARTNFMQVEHEPGRQACVAQDQRMILSKASRKRGRKVMESDVEEVRNSLETVTALEMSISQMRKTIEQLLTPVNVPKSRVTSFTSCWNPEPITMAYTVLSRAFHLEIVVLGKIDSIGNSWAFTGEVRIQEKVFKIEFGVPRGKLARTRPWSQRSKPEQKFEMRWIFEGDLKTNVVCKKCGTVSELENDFLVECPNSNCKLVFRTEHDKSIFDLSRRATQDVQKDSKTTRTTLSSDADLEDLYDEAEASPGRFKRVKIRHSSV